MVQLTSMLLYDFHIQQGICIRTISYCQENWHENNISDSPGLVFFVTSGSLNSTPSGRIYLNRKSWAARPEALSGAVKASRPTNV